jgi:lysophospholipid acyltransferase (LPLAT)-like uncharacterized protein
MAKIRVSPKLAGWVIATVMKLVGCTLRFRIDDRAGLLHGGGPSSPIIWLCWHNRIFMAPIVQWRFLRRRHGSVITSASRDGDVLTEVCRRFGLDAVRGSSSRRKVAALRESLACLERGEDICITPDGPRGPRYHLQPGVVLLAQKSQALIFPIHIRPRRCWRLQSWDGFIIPKPFSRVDVVFESLFRLETTDSTNAFDAQRASLEKLMRDGTGEASELRE